MEIVINCGSKENGRSAAVDKQHPFVKGEVRKNFRNSHITFYLYHFFLQLISSLYIQNVVILLVVGWNKQIITKL